MKTVVIVTSQEELDIVSNGKACESYEIRQGSYPGEDIYSDINGAMWSSKEHHEKMGGYDIIPFQLFKLEYMKKDDGMNKVIDECVEKYQERKSHIEVDGDRLKLNSDWYMNEANCPACREYRACGPCSMCPFTDRRTCERNICSPINEALSTGNLPKVHKAIDEACEWMKSKKTNGKVTQADYIKAQDAFGLKAGDKVKVLCKVENERAGWRNTWMSDMNQYIGKTITVKYIDGHYGAVCKFSGYTFPFYVLQKIDEPEHIKAMPEGYRLITDEERKGDKVEGTKFWNYDEWCNPSGFVSGYVKGDIYAIPIEPIKKESKFKVGIVYKTHGLGDQEMVFRVTGIEGDRISIKELWDSSSHQLGYFHHNSEFDKNSVPFYAPPTQGELGDYEIDRIDVPKRGEVYCAAYSQDRITRDGELDWQVLSDRYDGLRYILVKKKAKEIDKNRIKDIVKELLDIVGE